MRVAYYFLILFCLFSLSCAQSNKKIITANGTVIEIAEMDNFIQSQMDSLEITGLSIAVINDGEIVYHRAVGISNLDTMEKVDNESIFEAASLSKPVFAYFVMKMAKKGVLDLDRPLYFFYLPDSEMERDERYKRVTARMVLDHTTGFPNWRWFDPAPKEMNIRTGDFYMKSDPGSAFGYSGEGYHCLGRVLAYLIYVNMKELDYTFHREVSTPLGMNYAYYTWDDFLYDHKVTGHKNGKTESRCGEPDCHPTIRSRSMPHQDFIPRQSVTHSF